MGYIEQPNYKNIEPKIVVLRSKFINVFLTLKNNINVIHKMILYLLIYQIYKYY